ncbi:hypothetical protein H261_03183 [Paramagnetospirillum caucaseum]|uniref:Uncharacterized protein n=1 Tax=Paramagnetospirillum caucaseum TaxID=1244869 RepID=M3AFM8_9PROT|nr:hypothetical protein [Paramagnetospirillum caucaseum]EME71379.1 hypothetical protein H261_03183 [Paramagnetospirillum caucaseum]
MDGPITWSALASLIGAVGVICTGLWAVHGAIKREFQRAAELGERRTARTHDRIESLGSHISQTYLPLAVHAAEMRRVDEALEERDRQLEDLSARVPCPAARRPRRKTTPKKETTA